MLLESHDSMRSIFVRRQLRTRGPCCDRIRYCSGYRRNHKHDDDDYQDPCRHRSLHPSRARFEPSHGILRIRTPCGFEIDRPYGNAAGPLFQPNALLAVDIHVNSPQRACIIRPPRWRTCQLRLLPVFRGAKPDSAPCGWSSKLRRLPAYHTRPRIHPRTHPPDPDRSHGRRS